MKNDMAFGVTFSDLDCAETHVVVSALCGSFGKNITHCLMSPIILTCQLLWQTTNPCPTVFYVNTVDTA